MKVIKTDLLLKFLYFYESMPMPGEEKVESIDIASLRKWIDIESLDLKDAATEAEHQERISKILGIA